MSQRENNRNSSEKQDRAEALKLLGSIIRRIGWQYYGFVFATIGFALLALLPPQLFRYFTEGSLTLSVIGADSFIRSLLVFGAFVAFAMLISALGSASIQEWIRLRIEGTLRKRVMLGLHRMPLSVLDASPRGEWLARMTNDLHQVERFMTHSLGEQIRAATIFVGVSILFVWNTGSLALIPLGTAVALALINFLVQKRVAPILRQVGSLHGGIFQFLIESLEGIRTIRSHAVERFVHQCFESEIRGVTRQGMRLSCYWGGLIAGNELIGQLMVTACLMVACWALLDGQLLLSEALVFPFFIWLFYRAAQQLAVGVLVWNRYFVHGARLRELLNPEGYDPQNWQRIFNYWDDGRWSGSRTFVVDDLVVGFGTEKLIGPLGFQVRQGELWAITGPSGSGKSIFLEVLAGLRPAISGRGSLKDAKGRTVWDSGRENGELKLPLDLCAYVEQRPYIFKGSVRDNLNFGNQDLANDKQLLECLKRVGLEGRFRHEKDLNQQLHDRGGNLSEGQRYRLALCRAILLKRPFLLLDEPFGSLDKASMELICELLLEQKKECGIVLITHYLPPGLVLDGLQVFEDLLLKKRSVEEKEKFFRVIEQGSSAESTVFWKNLDGKEINGVRQDV